MDVFLLCVVRQRSLRRADHPSRGILSTVVCRCEWPRNLVNEEALAHWGLSRQKNKQTTFMTETRAQEKYFSPPKRNDRLWGPPSVPDSGFRKVLCREYSGRGVKLTTHHHVVQKLRMSGAVPLLHPYSYKDWTGTTSCTQHCDVRRRNKVKTFRQHRLTQTKNKAIP
jgi:hypothetical protein